jgi:hypothetical protein
MGRLRPLVHLANDVGLGFDGDTTTFVNAAVKLIQKRGPNPWPISHLESRLFVDLVDPQYISFNSNPPSSRNSVIIDSQIYMASTDAHKKAIESLQIPKGLQGMILVPWIEQRHFMLVVGYATGDDLRFRCDLGLWVDRVIHHLSDDTSINSFMEMIMLYSSGSVACTKNFSACAIEYTPGK